MNIKYITCLISSLILCLTFISCDSDNKTAIYNSSSKDAQIYSFSISGTHYQVGDSMDIVHDKARFEIVNKTKFAIDQIAGVIYNPDSMPFGTVLRNKVYVNATFNPTYGISGVEVTIPDSIKGFSWNKTDSIDFSKTPISFKVISPEGTAKTYDIDIRIHKIDPDTLVWQQTGIYPQALGKSKTLLTENDKFYTYSIRNGVVSLFSSDRNAISWQTLSPSGIPSNLKPESIFIMNSVFYAIDENGNSYKSNDGEAWARINNGRKLTSILGILPENNRSDDELLVIVEDGGKYYFGKTKDMSSVNVVSTINGLPNNEVPAYFSSRDGGSLTNYSTDKKTRMLILTGGLDTSGKEVSYTWIVKNTLAGLEVTPFIKNNLFGGVGVSNFFYNNSLYVFAENQFYISDTWGDTWYKAPNKQMLDPEITKRYGQSVIVDNENNIWIFGGATDFGFYLNDIWKGRLNKLIP